MLFIEINDAMALNQQAHQLTAYSQENSQTDSQLPLILKTCISTMVLTTPIIHMNIMGLVT